MISKKQYMQLVELATDVNGFKDRVRSITGNKPTIFIEFSGHVSLLKIRICTNGWICGEYADYEFEIHTDGRFDIYKYNEAIAFLTELKNAPDEVGLERGAQENNQL